jgi:alanyl-tRNA synthetase
MKLREVREKYLSYMKGKGHSVIPSSKLIPENDPTTLFTGSGMQPLIPYLLGQKHPLGNKITNSQKCFRSVDIDDIGDNRHTTFFEMLGNWSLGDYFKEEQLPWIFSFLIDEIKLDPNKIFVTVFSGDTENNLPRDDEAVNIWKKLFSSKGVEAKAVDLVNEENAGKVGMQDGRIFYYDSKKNWWSRMGVPKNMPANEPGGPDSEVFYLFESVKHDEKFGKYCHPNCDCGRFLEIGNSVFMEYKKNADSTFSKLPQRNVDFGGGLERITMVSENTPDIFLIDVLYNIIKILEKSSGKSYQDLQARFSMRVIADHLRATTFLVADGISPSNSDQGYFVRRLIRRAVRHMDLLQITDRNLAHFVPDILDYYKDVYPEAFDNKIEIQKIISDEETKFRKTLSQGLKEFNKLSGNISGEDAFTLFSTYGFPIDLTIELAKEKNISVDIEDYKNKFAEHQKLSRSGSVAKFKGGLVDTSDQSIKYHTATHLLHQALCDVLGQSVEQKGSNITPERLRFDFSYHTKMTDDEKKKVEDIINQKIKSSLPVNNILLPKDEALKTGAKHFFGEKYGDQVSIYYIGENLENAYSKEFCGGPHVNNTNEIGTFKIIKEEAVSSGVRRIKAVVV